MKSPDALCAFAVNNNLVERWLDSLDPSIRTYASNFVINRLGNLGYDLDRVVDEQDKWFVGLLSQHFFAFLRLEIMDQNPGRAITVIGSSDPVE